MRDNCTRQPRCSPVEPRSLSPYPARLCSTTKLTRSSRQRSGLVVRSLARQSARSLTPIINIDPKSIMHRVRETVEMPERAEVTCARATRAVDITQVGFCRKWETGRSRAPRWLQYANTPYRCCAARSSQPERSRWSSEHEILCLKFPVMSLPA